MYFDRGDPLFVPSTWAIVIACVLFLLMKVFIMIDVQFKYIVEYLCDMKSAEVWRKVEVQTVTKNRIYLLTYGKSSFC